MNEKMPLIIMALDAEVFLAVQHEIVRKRCPLGVVTGEAGHRLAVSRVQHPGAHGMAELPLGFVTSGANGVAVACQHGRIVGSVRIMAGGAITDLLVLMRGGGVTLEGTAVAASAHGTHRGA